MKKILIGMVSAVLCLSLSACSQSGKGEFAPAKDAAALRESGAFATGLTQIDQATACALYGMDEDTVTESAIYGSTSSAEELAIFTLDSDEAAKAAVTALQYRVEDRMEELEDYMPGEMDKLKDAVIRQEGKSVLLAIAADYGPINDFLEE